MKKSLLVVFCLLIFAGPAFSATCDSTYTTQVQHQGGGDTLVVCNSGGLVLDAGANWDFRGLHTTATITTDTAVPADTATVSIQFEKSNGSAVDTSVVFHAYITDTSVAGKGLASAAPSIAVNSDTGAFLNEEVTDKLILIETNASGEAGIVIGEAGNKNFWVKVLTAYGEVIVGPKLNFN